MTNIHPLPLKTAPQQRRRPVPRTVRLSRRQAMGASVVGLVSVVLTGLSLTHLAHGIQIVTLAPAWEAWSMAVGIDLGFVALELAQLSATSEKTLKKIGRWARPAIAITLGVSAVLNAFAFGAAAQGWMIAPAVALGLFIPGLIYAMTRVGATMWIDR